MKASLNINTYNSDFSHPFLSVLVTNLQQSNNLLYTTSQTSWSQIAFETIFYSFLKLISEGLIKIDMIITEHDFAVKFFNYSTTKFTVEALTDNEESDVIQDKLCRSIFASIVFNSNLNNGYPKVQKVLSSIIDKHIGNKKGVNNPEEKFIFKILENYNSVSLSLVEDKKQLFQFDKTYQLNLSKMDYKQLTQEITGFNRRVLNRGNEHLLNFKSELRNHISGYFSYRSDPD